MKIFVFGNPDLPTDSLPLKILPRLQANYPQHEFMTIDPNEEWEVPEDLVAIDTVLGLSRVTVFDDLDTFAPAPRLSPHDYDALTNLRYLKKLGKLKTVRIIGVPPDMLQDTAATEIIAALNQL